MTDGGAGMGVGVGLCASPFDRALKVAFRCFFIGGTAAVGDGNGAGLKGTICFPIIRSKY